MHLPFFPHVNIPLSVWLLSFSESLAVIMHGLPGMLASLGNMTLHSGLSLLSVLSLQLKVVFFENLQPNSFVSCYS